MRIGVLDDHRVVVVEDGGAVDVSHLLDTPAALMDRRPEIRAYLDGAPRLPLARLRFIAPSPNPRTLLAAPVNYRAHAGELGDRSPSQGLDARQLGLIVLATGSVTGPSGRIELPDLPGREFHFEGEIAVVIGREARNVPEPAALSHVLGYTGLIDVTMRRSDGHAEERSMRKSYHTFTPIGPYLLTADAAPAELALELELACNDEVRQRGRLRDLIVGVPELVSRASRMLPLLPGDVIATGTPAGVGPIVPGDELSLRVTGVGELRVPVVRRDW
jgi:2-keto-4-pentenoate hydratase/2-oxohepta-3-ene-1,7-dioic acid hydratase in catechol pathway